MNADSKASKARKSGNSDETVGRIELHDLAVAHMQAVWSAERMSELPKPFEESFRLVESVDLLERVSKIGTRIEEPVSLRHAGKGRRSQ